MANINAAPPGLDLSQSQQPRIIAVNIAGLSLAFLAVSARFFCRRISGAGLHWDDWLAIPALLSVTGLCLTTLVWAVPNGLGKHIWAAPEGSAQAASNFAKYVLVAELSYVSATVFTKFSILSLYLRIFQIQQIRKPIYFLMGLILAWGIIIIIVSLLQCVPLAGLWDPSVDAICAINKNIFFAANAIPTIATATAIIVLPWPFMWRLHLSQKQTIAAIAIFTLGSSAVLIGILRLVFIFTSDLESVDTTWDFSNSQIWTTVEICICIICACLPTLRPIKMPKEAEPEVIRILEISDPRMIKPTAQVIRDMAESGNRRQHWDHAQTSASYGECYPNINHLMDVEAFPFSKIPAVPKIDAAFASKSSSVTAVITPVEARQNSTIHAVAPTAGPSEPAQPEPAVTRERAFFSSPPGTICVRREFNIDWDMVSLNSLPTRPSSSRN